MKKLMPEDFTLQELKNLLKKEDNTSCKKCIKIAVAVIAVIGIIAAMAALIKYFTKDDELDYFDDFDDDFDEDFIYANEEDFV